MDQQTDPRIVLQTSAKTFPAAIFLVAFITGAIVMSFEMLGSRYLNPYFGSGIYTWASLISTVLAALCAEFPACPSGSEIAVDATSRMNCACAAFDDQPT